MRTLAILSLVVVVNCVSHELQTPPDASPDARIASFGESCEADSLCETGLCRETHRGAELPGGMCTIECVWGTPCSVGYCVFESENIGSCFPSCDEPLVRDDEGVEKGDTPCREDWECYFTVGVRVCAPEGW